MTRIKFCVERFGYFSSFPKKFILLHTVWKLTPTY
jgi:hypothetical protein